MSAVINIKRKCSSCGAHTTIDGVLYCWKCREKFPISTSGAVGDTVINLRVGQAGAVLSLLGFVAATAWWMLP